jgi:chorismate mutase
MTHPEEQLQGLRSRIDALDESVAKLLIERAGVIRDVAALKAQHWPKSCHIRPGREGQMHRTILKRFAGSGFPPAVALAIWRQLIGGSTHLESPLVVTAVDPNHRFLAREYFGLQVGTAVAPSIGEALARMEAGESNLLILPSPDVSGWWQYAPRLREIGLSIFACLPLVEGSLPTGVVPAVALAAVEPEPSGDDISYHVENGRLEKTEGFLPERPGIFLGAHPRPLSLNSGATHD